MDVSPNDPAATPAAIAGTTADYRSGATTDLADDEASFEAGARVDCPVLVLWGEQSFVGNAYEPLDVWREYAGDVRGTGLPVGHFIPEEAPEQVLADVKRAVWSRL